MKFPSDRHIAEQDCRFADCRLPIDAVLHGFTIDSDKSDVQVLNRLRLLEGQTPDEIVLDGRIKREAALQDKDVCFEKHIEAPFASFVAMFGKKINLVECRLQRMLELQDVTVWRNLDWLTYRDMVIVQVAAMCVDRTATEHDGYTIQSLLRRMGQEHLIGGIDKVLNKNVAVDADHNDVTVRIALKTIRDKFLCHYDNHENYDLYGNDKEVLHRWSLTDMFVLEQLLLPPVIGRPTRIGAVRELVLAIHQAFETATSVTKWKMFFDSLCCSERSA